MTPIFKKMFGTDSFASKLLLLILAIAPAVVGTTAVFGSDWHITGIQIDGNHRTRESWVMQYLDIHLPADYSDGNISDFRQKLLTTGVFYSVRTDLVEVKGRPGTYDLLLTVDEKWTTIPVLRGAYGGGTPLKVVGLYDTHVFGSLWTFGIEGRQYGSSPPGAVVWGKAPRWITGKHLVGGEAWREFRERIIFDSRSEAIGSVRTNSTMGKANFLAPLTIFGPSTDWQGGFDFRMRRDEPSEFRADDGYLGPDPTRVVLPVSKSDEAIFMGTLVHDNVRVDGLDLNGVRLTLTGGPVLTEDGNYAKEESELFAYKDLGNHWNIAVHGFAAQTNHDRFQDQYFLGGFDSVRGFADGIAFGSKIAHGSFELRKVANRWKYLWLQDTIFIDGGTAVDNWGAWRDEARSSAGIGVRFAIPQIYRLMFRIDHAWALDGSGAKGITAGFNQFFDPYKPL